jgi:biotin operon repressor
MPSLRDGAARLRSAARQLAELANRLERGQAHREDFNAVIAEIVGTAREQFGPRPRARRSEGGKAQILAYLKHRVGQPVYGDELAAASGIGEWARRVRELRVQDGYDITELGNSIYQLNSPIPDLPRAKQWHTANEIRRRLGSARSRIEAFLEANVGDVVTRDQIDYVAGIKEGSRRIREVRDEAGWPINSHIDEEGLDPGEYRLLSTAPADRRDASQREYPEDLRQRVFERDHYTCQVCGRNREKALAAGGTRFYLEVHHKVAMADDVASLPVAERHDIDNLVTLCHSDHVSETRNLQAAKAARRRAGAEPDSAAKRR